MFIRFNLDSVLLLHKENKINENYLDIEGLKHIDKWRSFVDTLSNLNNENVSIGHGPSRAAYSLVDRTQSIPSIIKTHIDEDQLIPNGNPSSLDILDICLARADELLKTGKHINVLWSGGVDSTVMLFSLIRQAQNIDQLSIICTFESIIESGGLFDSAIKNSGIRIKFDQTRCNTNLPYSYDVEDSTQIYVTGQCADQLFGAPKFLKIPGINLTDPWYSGYNQNLIDLIEPSLKYSRRPIETVNDLRWWALFNYTWTTVLYDDCIDRPDGLARRISSFYATPDFQKWAMHTPTYYDSVEEYKGPMKQALSQLIDYPYYIKHKRKTMSYTWRKNKNWYLLDKNFKTYYTHE
jgi:hypothetical protein